MSPTSRTLGTICGGFVLAIGLLLARNSMLDSAILMMKEDRFEQAASKLQPLAKLGDSTAQSLLGDLYAFGWGVPKSNETAIELYRRAGTDDPTVNDAAAPAMYYVGKRYLDGPGARDLAEGKKWLERASKGRFGKATERLKELSGPDVAE